MKIAIGYRIVIGPWGGGNLFVTALRDFLLSEGHDVVFDLADDDIDIILIILKEPKELEVNLKK